MLHKNTTVLLQKHLDVTDLGGEKVMIDFTTGKYFLLKGTANDIWDLISTEISIGSITQHLCSIYDVEEDVCYQSVVTFLEQIEQYGFIQFVG